MSENEKTGTPLPETPARPIGTDEAPTAPGWRSSDGPDLDGIVAPPAASSEGMQPSPSLAPEKPVEPSATRQATSPGASAPSATPDAPPTNPPESTTAVVAPHPQAPESAQSKPAQAPEPSAREIPLAPVPQRPSAQAGALHHQPVQKAPAPRQRSFWKNLLSPFINLPDAPASPAERPPVLTSPNTGATKPGEAGPSAGPGVKPPVVTFRHVTKIFNQGTPQEYKAIENIDFEIEDLPDVGEFIALVGPSGCGKSTVLNLIQGFPDVWPPTHGEVLVRNKPVTGPGKDRGMIFQKYSSFPNRTVLQNVLFGLELNRDSLGYSPAEMKARAMDMINKVGLIGHENKYPYQLSGGQQQRVAIARTLVLRPRIILMDEPFSALDEPTRIDMQALITHLWHEVEATVFIVTHSLAEAVYLGDRIFMFTPGPGRLAEKVFIKPSDIGKEPGMSPLDVQEGDKFKTKLHEITGKFLAYEEGSRK